jgi:hypothetical protein
VCRKDDANRAYDERAKKTSFEWMNAYPFQVIEVTAKL